MDKFMRDHPVQPDGPPAFNRFNSRAGLGGLECVQIDLMGREE